MKQGPPIKKKREPKHRDHYKADMKQSAQIADAKRVAIVKASLVSYPIRASVMGEREGKIRALEDNKIIENLPATIRDSGTNTVESLLPTDRRPTIPSEEEPVAGWNRTLRKLSFDQDMPQTSTHGCTTERRRIPHQEPSIMQGGAGIKSCPPTRHDAEAETNHRPNDATDDRVDYRGGTRGTRSGCNRARQPKEPVEFRRALQKDMGISLEQRMASLPHPVTNRRRNPVKRERRLWQFLHWPWRNLKPSHGAAASRLSRSHWQ